MPQLRQSVPRYRKHWASGQAIVSILGRDFYLGPYGSRASKVEYDRLIAEWLVSNREPILEDDQKALLTVAELIARYWKFAKTHYRKGGKPTSTLEGVKQALRPLRRLYGHTKVAAFGPLALKAVRQKVIEAGISRGIINKRVGQSSGFFSGLIAEQLVHPSIFQALQAVVGLQKGRTEAPDRKPVAPIEDATVDATLPHLPPVVGDMVRFQRLTGCRPEEVCILRPGDIDRSGDVWEHRPGHHKTEHHDCQRLILVGSKAQEMFCPYLLRSADAYCFSPVDSGRRRKVIMRANRKTPVQPSQVNRRKRKPDRKPGDHYTTCSYRRSIHKAIEKVNRRAKKAAEEAKARGESVELKVIKSACRPTNTPWFRRW